MIKRSVSSDDLATETHDAPLGLVVRSVHANESCVQSQHMKTLVQDRENLHYVLFTRGVVGPIFNWELTSIVSDERPVS